MAKPKSDSLLAITDHLNSVDKAWNVAQALRLTEDRIWRPAGPPLAPRKV